MKNTAREMFSEELNMVSTNSKIIKMIFREYINISKNVSLPLLPTGNVKMRLSKREHRCISA